MTTTRFEAKMNYNVDWNNQALDLRQGFSLAYTFLTKRKREKL